MHPFYFGNSERPLFCAYHPPRSHLPRDEDVLLCYPPGPENMRTHWAFRQLSSLLSKEGFHVLRFYYYGTGDSSGESKDDSVSQWKDNIRAAFNELKDTLGVNTISLVGLLVASLRSAFVQPEKMEEFPLYA